MIGRLGLICSLAFSLLGFVASLAAQPVIRHLPECGAAPLLHIRLIGPSGMKATLYPGEGPGRTFEAPVAVGLRPGYVYRLQLSGLPQHPATLSPSLEVIGTLQLPPSMNAADYPAPVVFSREDIDRALAGTFITKVVYLEHPDQASAAVTRPDQPFEMEVEPSHDPVNAARSVGRPMLIVRFGGREQDPKELARQAIPGTVLLPGEKTLPRAVRPPCIPCVCVPLVDPILGPRPPEEECLHDGGDAGLKAGIGPDGKLHGLDPADAVAEYTDSQGRRHVKPSNRVCICVPRFGVLRTMIATAGFDTAFAIDAARSAVAQANIEARWPSKVAVQSTQIQAVKSKQRPSATTTEFGIHDIEQVQANAIVVGMMHGDAVVGTVLKKPQEQPDRPLILTKSADKQAAQIGDVITFTVKYSNPGGQPITNVAVSDSLTGRLEYVNGSARSDRDATFTFQPNSAGSMILRWEVSGRLLPGESGEVTFQARVR